MSESQTSDSDGFLSPELSASPDKNSDRFKPLMMKIQTNNVNKCVTTDGRKLHVNDIIWGKIQGFPWWPGRVMSITITKRDNGLIIAQLAHVAWFGSSTRSHMPCDEIFPFLEDFKVRYNKKKRGPYKLAIRQATMAARRTSGDGSLDTGIQHVDS
ncbi:hypothetical protein LOTGIDRAFT_142303 [Lottia gigantea]|uniref:PWWP domain-containing protein n=1 Tax=Lottia gigantea TaxID=225164 RepID=V4AZ80_LOTGI|nr:hypothetical protein LOTGIDRAFT_142303 [Lottia gigantea]ESO99041.1 hypothetical protein LOTGIDRAFT_142303 [Lottia gigantea]